MSLIDAPEIFYFKLNILLLVSFIFWTGLSCIGGIFSFRSSSRGKLTTARLLLICVLLLPFIIQWFSIKTPFSTFTETLIQEVNREEVPTVSDKIIFRLSGLVSFPTDVIDLSDKPVEGELFIQRVTLFQVFRVLIIMGVLWKLFETAREVILLLKLIRGSHIYKCIGSIKVLYSDAIAIPMATRFAGKSYIVLPSALLLSKKDIFMVIRHEGEHLRNGDLGWSWLMECLSITCFWNPAVYGWKITLHNLQEYACDETLLLKKNFSEKDYGNCLIRVAESAIPEHYPFSASMSLRVITDRKSNTMLSSRITLLSREKTRLSGVVHAITRIILLTVVGICSVVAFGVVPTDDIEDREKEQNLPEAVVKLNKGTAVISVVSAENMVHDRVAGKSETLLEEFNSQVTAATNRLHYSGPAGKPESADNTAPDEVKRVVNQFRITRDNGAQDLKEKQQYDSGLQPETENKPYAGMVHEEDDHGPEITAESDFIAEINENEECRTLMSPGFDEEKTFCGTQQQWQEYEKRLALLDPDMECRQMRNIHTSAVNRYCGTATEWQSFENNNGWVINKGDVTDRKAFISFVDDFYTYLGDCENRRLPRINGVKSAAIPGYPVYIPTTNEECKELRKKIRQGRYTLLQENIHRMPGRRSTRISFNL